jgi:putative ABC transport system permease protein
MSIRSSIARTAFETLKSNPSHTFMSISGLVIGVAALVGVLSLADGMQEFGRNQVNTTTDLQSVRVSIVSTEMVDGIRVRRANVPVFDLAGADSLQKILGERASATLVAQRNALISLPEDTIRTAALVYAASNLDQFTAPLLDGRFLSDEDILLGRPVAMISESLADRIARSNPSEGAVGMHIRIDSVDVEVVGVLAPPQGAIEGVLVPVTAQSIFPDRSSIALQIKADLVEDIPQIKEDINGWADREFKQGRSAISVQSNDMRIEQMQKAVLLFKTIMGLITGISVLVGGVGIMNVLMMSVKERTKEIGVRKAVGARKNDIVFQFMIESVTISSVGCAVGLLTGLAAVYAISPIVRNITDIPFYASFSWGSLVVIAITAAAIGITFGTYPAYTAARLSPVDAFRYE